jgi:hypothetical protein
MTTMQARWIAAQIGERRFHCDYVDAWGSHADVAPRRAREEIMRHWYAGMLRIPHTVQTDASVTDIGCGPNSLLLTYPTTGQMIAVDPLRFTDADEDAYARAHIARHIGAAERYDGPLTDEVWLYNCLQHVIDWERVLTVACQTAQNVVRIFEWIDVATDALHLHRLAEPDLRRVLHHNGFREQHMVRGETANDIYAPTRFYAALWERTNDERPR